MAVFGCRERASDLADNTVRKLPSPKPSCSAFCSPSDATINTVLDAMDEACIERALTSAWESSRKGFLGSEPACKPRNLRIFLAVKASLGGRATAVYSKVPRQVSPCGSMLGGIFSLLSAGKLRTPRNGEALYPKSFVGNILIGVSGALGVRALRRALPNACCVLCLEFGFILYQ